MAKLYIIVASVLLGSMFAGHAHAVTAPHDAGLRKLLQDNYGDWYDPYGVDTDDDYYASNDGYFYAYPANGGDTYGDQYDPYGVDYDDDYYASNDGYFYRYPSVDSVTDSLVAAGGNAASSYIDNDCTGASVADHACQLLGGAGAVNDQISDGIQQAGQSLVSSLVGGRRLHDDDDDDDDDDDVNYRDWYDPYSIDTDDDYYSSRDGSFINKYPDSYDDDYLDEPDEFRPSDVTDYSSFPFNGK